MKIKLAIVGGRDFTEYVTVMQIVEHLQEEFGYQIEEIVSGGAKGADTMAEWIARDYKFPLKVFPADWDTYGKRAGFMRNVDIVERADVVVAFWDGRSPGTKHSINLARELKKELFIYYYND